MPDKIIRYRERARHLREMSINISDIAAKNALRHLAGEYEAMAVQIELALAEQARPDHRGNGKAL